MCLTFYKYYLITGTSFMATAGLYFGILTHWLWMSEINDYPIVGIEYDWRIVPQYLGYTCLVLFSVGLLLVLRAQVRELMCFAVVLFVPLLLIFIVLILQLTTKEVIFDMTYSDIFLMVVECLMMSIMLNLLFFIKHIRSTVPNERSSNRDDFFEVDL